jgi:hypothetical protein
VIYHRNQYIFVDILCLLQVEGIRVLQAIQIQMGKRASFRDQVPRELIAGLSYVFEFPSILQEIGKRNIAQTS